MSLLLAHDYEKIRMIMYATILQQFTDMCLDQLDVLPSQMSSEPQCYYLKCLTANAAHI
jgi:hypothetical protein